MPVESPPNFRVPKIVHGDLPRIQPGHFEWLREKVHAAAGECLDPRPQRDRSRDEVKIERVGRLGRGAQAVEGIRTAELSCAHHRWARRDTRAVVTVADAWNHAGARICVERVPRPDRESNTGPVTITGQADSVERDPSAHDIARTNTAARPMPFTTPAYC